MKNKLKNLAYSMLCKYIFLVIYILAMICFIQNAMLSGLILSTIGIIVVILHLTFEWMFIVKVLKNDEGTKY